jgi:hypothetical protein
MVTRFDRDVGRMAALVEELGLENETIFILTSDNGSTFNLGGYDPEFFDGTGGLRGFKTNLYEGGIRVPLIATWPGHIPRDSTSDATIANWDIFPTILGLTGVKTEAELDGIDLAPVMLGTGEAPAREALYWEYHSRGGIQAVRMGKWKAVRSKAHGNPDGPIELYDLQKDPTESTDVAAKHPGVVARIDDFMRESRTVAAVPSWNFSDEERSRPETPRPGASSKTRTWTGKGDGVSFSDPENWTGEGKVTITAIRDTFVVDDAGAIVGGSKGCDLIDCDGGILEIRSGRLSGNSKGFRNGTLRISGGEVERQYVLNSRVRISGTGLLRLHGAGNPVNGSHIFIQSEDARVEFVNEDPGAVRSEHLHKVSVDGANAKEGGNIVLEATGKGGTIVRSAGRGKT